MLQQLKNHNQDIKRLIDEGYELEINDKHICVHHIPYVNLNRKVAFATLLCPYTKSGMRITPVDHTIYFLGDSPCDKNGNQLEKIYNLTNVRLTESIVANHRFSSRPVGRNYHDFHEKFTTYIAIISNEAKAIQPDVKIRTYAPIKSTKGDSVFNYMDTNASRSNIDFLNSKFQEQKIAIIGLGGTGGYILDFVAKTPVKEIHIYDNDTFNTHNAFRCPGAATLEILDSDISKVDYLKNIYSNMHKHIIPHNEFVDEKNLSSFLGYDFVFVCVDSNKSRMNICSYLTRNDVKYIDVGLGVDIVDDKLSASIRVSYPHGQNISVLENHCGKEGREDDLYASNIQIAELNALNAIHAVMKWKRESGYYTGTDDFHTLIYNTSMNKIIYE